MNNFVVQPHFCFGGYTFTMSMEDTYCRKVFTVNDEFRHWMPLVVNANESAAFSAFQNFQPSVNNRSPPAINQNRNCFPVKVDGGSFVNRNLLIPEVNNGLSGHKSPVHIHANKKQEDVSFKGVYHQPPNLLSFGEQRNQLLPKSQLINSGTSASFPGIPTEHHYGTFGAAKTAKSSSYVSSPNKSSVASVRSCNFCRQNGDPREFYESHQLKDSMGNVVCPILRSYVCEICGATGSQAHTVSYCPSLRAAGQKPTKNIVSLKKTLRNSSGRIRRQHM